MISGRSPIWPTAAEKAKRLPAFEASFRNLFLNQRVAAQNHFLTPERLEADEGAPDFALFDDLPVFGGLDLSGRNDLTALVLVAREPSGVFHVWPHFFAPEGGLRDRADRDCAPLRCVARPGVADDHARPDRRLCVGCAAAGRHQGALRPAAGQVRPLAHRRPEARDRQDLRRCAA